MRTIKRKHRNILFQNCDALWQITILGVKNNQHSNARDVWFDNVKKCDSISCDIQCTAGNSLTPLIASPSLDDIRHYAACNAPIWDETAEVHFNGDNHIQNFNLWRYIVGYTLGIQILRLRLCVAVKLNCRPYIGRYTSPNENFEYTVIP